MNITYYGRIKIAFLDLYLLDATAVTVTTALPPTTSMQTGRLNVI